MDIGASLWATAIQTTETGAAITKTRHIGCRWGYSSLVYEPDSPSFSQAKATGLTVKDWQNLIMVNQFGKRFWNEADGSYKFFNAAMAYHGDKSKLNGGGPIWAIFDAEAATREKWKPEPPHVDPDGYFFRADTLVELAAKIKNPYQRQPMPGAALEEAVARQFLRGRGRQGLQEGLRCTRSRPRRSTPRSTPILHDTLTVATNTSGEVIDTRGKVTPASIAPASSGWLRPARASRAAWCSAASPAQRAAKKQPEVKSDGD
jgi:hypothetical protein